MIHLLVFAKHISEKISKAYMMLGIIKRHFAHTSRNCFVTLYKSLVRSHLEYANSVWYPKRKTDVDKLDEYKRATKLISESSNKPYRERLKILHLPTLKVCTNVTDDRQTHGRRHIANVNASYVNVMFAKN